eukprot:5108758-Pyramimonas_sp.AAC.1
MVMMMMRRRRRRSAPPSPSQVESAGGVWQQTQQAIMSAHQFAAATRGQPAMGGFANAAHWQY